MVDALTLIHPTKEPVRMAFAAFFDLPFVSFVPFVVIRF